MSLSQRESPRLALAGSLIVPGIAGADPVADVSATDVGTYTSPGNYSIKAENKGDCTAEFRLTNISESKSNWRADYRVGEEEPNMNIDNPRPAYRPAVGSNKDITDAIAGRALPYPMGNQIATVDLKDPRVVPTSNTAVKTLPGVSPNETGTHEVKFGVYQGPSAVGTAPYQETVSITVTGCPTTPVDDNDDETPDAGSLDFGSLDFGSLFGNLSSSDSS